MKHPIEQYRQQAILIDTNLLVLFLVGMLGGDAIAKCKRTGRYIKEDHALLRRTLAFFPSVLVTPMILAETCNLLESFNNERDQVPFRSLQALMMDWEEQSVPSVELMDTKTYPKFGLTDASIAQVAADGNPVLSDDLKLVMALSGQGLPVFNFNYLRDHAYFSRF